MFLMSICFCRFGRFQFRFPCHSTLNANVFARFFLTHGSSHTALPSPNTAGSSISFLAYYANKVSTIRVRARSWRYKQREIRRLSICRLNYKLHLAPYMRRQPQWKQPRQPNTKTSHTDLVQQCNRKIVARQHILRCDFPKLPIIISPVDCIKR